MEGRIVMQDLSCKVIPPGPCEQQKLSYVWEPCQRLSATIFILFRFQQFLKIAEWTIWLSRWKKKPISSICLASVQDFTMFLPWQNKWNPWNTTKTALTSCDLKLRICIILSEEFAHNCTETNVLYIWIFRRCYILKPDKGLKKRRD